MTDTGGSEALRAFCTSLLRQYDRLVETKQHNFGAALCIVQRWDADKLRAALDTPVSEPSADVPAIRPWHSQCRCTQDHHCAACDVAGRLNNVRLGVERLAHDTEEATERLHNQLEAIANAMSAAPVPATEGETSNEQ